jgi:uncharacterized protein (DUF433 family)
LKGDCRLAANIQSLPRVSIEHIEVDERGRARVAGHRIEVPHIVVLHGYSAEQLQTEAYSHLSLAQIHASLAYYYDHQAEIDRQIMEEQEFDELLRQRQQNDPEFQARIAIINARAIPSQR